MSFLDRLSNGWTLAMNSFKVLKENKQLIIFPILSGVSLLLVIASFFTGLLATNGWELDNLGAEQNNLTIYLIAFLFYVANYFVIVFFNMALVHCTRLYFRGEEVTVRAGL